MSSSCLLQTCYDILQLVIFIALCLAAGMVTYIDAVTDEASHVKPNFLLSPLRPWRYKHFYYSYGWSFYVAASSFIWATMAGLLNISYYDRCPPNLDDSVYSLRWIGFGGKLKESPLESHV